MDRNSFCRKSEPVNTTTKALILSCVAFFVAVFSYFAYKELVQESVWIQGDRFDTHLKCDVPKSATAGEWVTLDASRLSGPWERVRKSSLKEGQFSLPAKPPESEDHVAPHLQWQTEPQTAKIKQPSRGTIEFDLKFRQVMFLQPGDYRIRAVSHWPYEDTTDWVTIAVSPNPTEQKNAPELPAGSNLKSTSPAATR